MNQHIPIYRPSLTGKERAYVLECLDSTWISSKGKFIKEFETNFANYIGSSHAVSVSNGTAALHLALVALGIGPGDEVIVPTLTYIASVNAIAYTGATPVFVDSLQVCWQADPEDIARKVTSKTKAVMAVHLYGHPCDLDPILTICRQYGLFLIEDCAEAIGSFYKGKHVGTFSDIATFSFFGNKTITTGEGGMVVTNNAERYETALHLRGQGLAKNRQYWHDVVGYNYRMTNICAALGVAQLEQADLFLQKKRNIAQKYKECFAHTAINYQGEMENVVHSYWMFSILVSDARDREALRCYLDQKGIETRPLFYPIHTMPMYSKKEQQFSVAEDLAARGINLPSFPDLKEDELN